MQRDPTHPGPHPSPPTDASQLDPLMHTSTGTWFRIHSRARHPLYFGSSGVNRFDAPDGSYGVLYVAAGVACAFIEVFGQATPFRILDRTALANRAISVLSASRRLSLVDLTAEGLARIGADARLVTGEHRVSQQWSRALFDHPSRPDGILYRARHDPSRMSAAIFDRASAVITVESTIELLDSKVSASIFDIFSLYGYAFADT